MATSENATKDSGFESEALSVPTIDNFKHASSKLIDRFLKYFKLEDFSLKYYPEIYKNDPSLLRDVHSQFLVQLKEKIIGDLDELLNDQMVYPKLVELEKVAEESNLSEDVKAWRPSGDPNEDIRDHRWRYKLAHKKSFESLLENLSSQNEQLEKEVMAEHEKIMTLKEKILKQDEKNKADFSAFEEVNLDMIESVEQMEDDT